jgi:exosortase C (VPDSG-CTERM-specific)
MSKFERENAAVGNLARGSVQKMLDGSGGGMDFVRRQKLRSVAIFVSLLGLTFLQPLIALGIYCAHSNFYSYIILIPAISAYLLMLRWKQLPPPGRSILPAVAFLGGGLVTLGVAWYVQATSSPWSEIDRLSLLISAFVACLVGGGFLFLGANWITQATLPIAFLVFMIPLPDSLADLLETASKLASAEVANLFFNVSGIPVLRDGVLFELPGIAIRVAQECSGIHSSLVLFITSILTACLLLQSRWRRLLLVAFVIPLGLIRNGFRIFVIGWLCVHVSPKMIDSPIHHHGGPIFFVISLIPLFMLLWVLRKGEMRQERRTNVSASAAMGTGRS